MFITAILVWVSSNLNWNDKNWNQILEADARGYYAYLPAIFIYQDLNFGFFETVERDKYQDPHHLYDYRAGANGKVINKYFAGTALAQIPFFLIAHGLTLLSGGEADGYSWQYSFWIHISAIFYAFIGLWFLDGLLLLFGISGIGRSLTLLAIVFATNLFYYVVGEPGMSHVFSFAFTSMFLFFSLRFFNQKRDSDLIFLAGCLGMIVLIRPVNGWVLFLLPFTAGSVGHMFTRLREGLGRPGNLMASIVLFFLLASLQPLIYQFSCGSFFVYAYGDEGFDFLHPHVWDFLFSYKKGAFVYTPILLISLLGLIPMWKRNRFQAVWVFLFWLGLIYILSSWWNWWYGGSFSCRVWVEFLPLSALMLAFLIEATLKFLRGIPVIFLLFMFVALCQFQTYQYRYYLIHWEDMNKDRYWEVFLKRP